MSANKWTKGFLILFALLFLCTWACQGNAWARAGSRSSIGSRGSRTGSTARPYTPPRPSQPAVTPSPGSHPGGFLRSFGGGILGGLAGGLLFRSLFGGSYGGGGIGLLDILLLCGIIYLIYRIFFRKKTERIYAASGVGVGGAPGPAYQAPYPPAYDQPQVRATDQDLEQGLANIRQFDPDFDEAKFQDMVMDLFFKTQGAWANRDMSPVRNLFTEEMYGILEADVERMRSERKVNRLENIAVRSVDITEAWQESGKDYLTARIYANLLDYSVDETTGQVVEGSKSEPVKFEEYWTFIRPVGSNPWQLSAIQQAPA
jgi:predicted lipid-binding transport protein (Tim44 family)